MMKKLAVIMAMALVLCGALAISAQAMNPILDFHMGSPTPGTITFSGPGNGLDGVDIQVDTITAIGTTQLPGQTFDLVQGLLQFDTGDLASVGAGVYHFLSGGYLHITGAIPSLGINDPNTYLMGFSLGVSSAMVGVSPFGGGTLTANLIPSSAMTTFNSTLISSFAIPTESISLSFVNLSFSTTTPINPNTASAFTSSAVLNGDVSNTFVPVPPSLALLGSGLLGLVGFRLRWKLS